MNKLWNSQAWSEAGKDAQTFADSASSKTQATAEQPKEAAKPWYVQSLQQASRLSHERL
jgi:hypothetical protein